MAAKSLLLTLFIFTFFAFCSCQADTPVGITTLQAAEDCSVSAKLGDFLTVHYTGSLDDGTVFDSSRKPGREPIRFQLGGGQVIRGWDEGLIGACVGETRELVIPPEKAYGKKGSPPVIPPDATLTFNVELLGAESQNGGGRGFNLGEILIILAFFGCVAALLIYLPTLNDLDKKRRKPSTKSPKRERELRKSK